MNPSFPPSARMSSACAYDVESDRLILYGGKTIGGIAGTLEEEYHNDTWVYNFNEDTWSKLAFTTSPGKMEGHVLCYDSQSDMMLLVGGHTSSTWNKDSWGFRYYPNRPTPPKTLQATYENATVLLTWEEPSSDGESPITNYIIYRRTNNTNYTKIKQVGLVYEYRDIDVLSNITYYYIITAINKIAESEYSIEVNVVVPLVTSTTSFPYTRPHTTSSSPTSTNASISTPGWILFIVFVSLITTVWIYRSRQRFY